MQSFQVILLVFLIIIFDLDPSLTAPSSPHKSSHNFHPLTISVCDNNAEPPFCCKNGAKNADCCLNDGFGKYCCPDGSEKEKCCENWENDPACGWDLNENLLSEYTE